jgi:hypothetical protein
MKLSMYLTSLSFMLLLFFLNTNAQDIKINVGDVKDSRTTGQFFAGLEIDLQFLGDALEDVKSIQCTINKAVDDTGRDLIKEEESVQTTEINKDNPGRADFTIKLKNPSRRAMTIKELSGEVEMYIPKNDPNAIVTIKNFTSQPGKSLVNKGLNENNIKVSVLTTDQYESVKEKQKAEADTSILGQMVSSLANFFGGFSSPGKNSIILELIDPESRIINIEFVDQHGKVIDTQGSSSNGDIHVYDFEKSMPKNAQLKLYLKTRLAIKNMPFNLKDIDLP